MKSPTKHQLTQQLKGIKESLYYLQKQVHTMLDIVEATVPEKEWYSTAEAAKIAGVKPKTATNYCSTGVWKETRRTESGRYEIHHSELEKYL